MLRNGGFLRLDHAFAYAKPPSSQPLPWAEFLTLAPDTSVYKKSNQSILKEISPEYSLEGLRLKLKLQYFGHLM